MRASLSFSTMVPRALRTNLVVRLIMPWRLPWAATLTLPVPVILKRFLAPLLVFSLGILLAPLRWRRWAAAGFSKHKKPPRHAPPGGLRRSHSANAAGAQEYAGRIERRASLGPTLAVTAAPAPSPSAGLPCAAPTPPWRSARHRP